MADDDKHSLENIFRELDTNGDGVLTRDELAQAIVQAGISEPALDELIEKERRLSENMLNLHSEAKRLGDVKKPGGALKWILLLVALLALGGTAALVYLNYQ